MMKKIIIILCFLTLYSCNSQVFYHKYEKNYDLKITDTIRNFDINKFIENSKKYNAVRPNILNADYQYHSYTYTTKDGTYVQQNQSKSILDKEGSTIYIERRRKQNSPLQWRFVYNKKGNLVRKTEEFLGEDIGQTVVYDENGKVIEEIDNDKWYKHTFADIRKIVLHSKGIDIYDDTQALVERSKDKNRIPQRTYLIKILKKGNIEYFIKDSFIINDETGKEINREEIKILE